MGDPILITGDQVIFDSAFGLANVVVRPGVMQGTGKASVMGKKVCVAGDEMRVMVSGCPYTTATHSTPGTGSLMIQKLVPQQESLRTKSGKKPVLIATSKFVAKFMVMVPAQMPAPPGPPVPDTTIQYVGTGEFKSGQTTSKLGG